MTRVALALLVWSLPSACWAACPANPSDCPAPTYKSVTIGGSPGTLSVTGLSTLSGGANITGGTQTGADVSGNNVTANGQTLTLAQWMALTTIGGVTNTYTTSGAIALTDSLAIANCASSWTLTVADGGASVLQMAIHGYGVSPATISFSNIEGGPNTVTLSAIPSGVTLLVRWIPSLSSWIIMSGS